jgi:hypothetical protein
MRECLNDLPPPLSTPRAGRGFATAWMTAGYTTGLMRGLGMGDAGCWSLVDPG